MATERSISATADNASGGVSADSTVVPAIEPTASIRVVVRNAIVLLHRLILAKVVGDNRAVLVDTTLHLLLTAGSQHRQRSRGEQWGGDVGGAAHGLQQSISEVAAERGRFWSADICSGKSENPARYSREVREPQGRVSVADACAVAYMPPAGFGFCGSYLAIWTFSARPSLASSQMP